MSEKVSFQPVEGYDSLAEVLADAYNQAAVGKGDKRHANNLPFHMQPMQQIIKLNGIGFAAGQVSKKVQEAQGMFQRGEYAAGYQEILGAIVYASGINVFITNTVEQ